MRKLRILVAITLGAVLLAATAATAIASPAASAPPSIVRLALGRPVLGPSGGGLTIRLDVRNAESCRFSAPAAVQMDRSSRACFGGRDYRVVRLAPTYAPTEAGWQITAWVTGTNGTTIHESVVLRQEGRPPLDVSVSSTLTLGQPYAEHVGVTGGHGPYTLQVTSGSLPPGISLSAAGDLSGTPTSSGTYSATVAVTDSSTPQPLRSTVTLVLRVVGQPLSLTTTSLPTATQGQYYQVALAASGGNGPYTFTITSGYLPTGMTLGSTGTLSGIPTSSGSYPVTVRVTDSSSPPQSASRQLTLVVVGAPLQVTSSSSLVVGLGVPYVSSLTATGGTTPYTWTLAYGSLPPGLTLLSTGVIQGTTYAVGTYVATVIVRDASQPQLSATVYLAVTVATTTFSITTPTTLTPSAVAGSYYSFTFTASGGTTPYWWQVVGGTVPPPGLTLSPTGVLSGTATTAGTYSFTVQAWDSATPVHTASETVSLTVLP